MENQIVIFQLGNELFGVDITHVESIIKLQPITQLPNTAAYIEGITNLRGKIVPVIDLRKRLGLSLSPATRDTRIIVVALGDIQAGMIVDAVSEVLTISTEMVEPVPAILTSVDSSMVTGLAKVGKDDQQPVILLDLGEVLVLKNRADFKPVAA